MIKRGFALFSALLCLFCFFINASAEEEATAPSTTSVMVLKNINTGINVEVDAADSVTYRATGVAAKLVTAMVAHDVLKDCDKKISTPLCISKDKYAGAILNDFSLGLKYSKTSSSLTVDDLLSAAIVSSAADACIALAVASIRYENKEQLDFYNNYDGAVSASTVEEAHINTFVDKMNLYAEGLGCKDTHFTNCTGAVDPASHTTAEDIALIAEAFYNNEALMMIADQPSYTLSTGSNLLFNKSALMSSNDNLTGYTGMEGVTGIIIGWMGNKGASPYCVVCSGETQEGVSYVMVCVTPFTETAATKQNAYDTVKNFMPWALNTFRYKLVVSTLDAVKTVPVKSGKDSDGVSIVAMEDIELLIPAEVDPEKDIRVEYKWLAEELTAPVSKGQKVGTVYVYYNDEVLSTDLIANSAVSESSMLSFLDRMMQLLTSDGAKKTYLCLGVLFGGYLILSFIMFLSRIIGKYIAAGRGD
ncbi:MAG: D-alanyl-D-alanine carboxypeptidase [Ruminococcaceae bacterium]|nr:D-alanyl-D-alanine carboxypeptidase [Oscillospiraceae bacterium]